MASIGVQAMMLKSSFASVGSFDTLRRVSELGYHTAEISQIPMTAENVAGMVRARAELGVDIAALSAVLDPVPGGADSLSENFEKIVAECRALDTRFVRIGMMPLATMTSLDEVLAYCRRVDSMAVQLAEHGVTLCFHNHHMEFARFDGRWLLDLILEAAPHLRLELDVHWVQRGGHDPVRSLRKYADSTDLVHLKDYRIGAVDPDLMRARMDSGWTWTEAFTANVQFAEVGEGTLDFRAIIDQALSTGVQYLFVEQDEFYGRDPFDCLATSRANLVALGYESLFGGPR